MDNKKAIKLFKEILKKSMDESPEWCRGLGDL